jgi:hypothetical protein
MRRAALQTPELMSGTQNLAPTLTGSTRQCTSASS